MTTESIIYVERNNQIFFSSEEIGKQLGYSNPYKSVNTLYSRNVLELRNYSTILKLRTVDGKEREVRHFTEEGVYILSMLANTEQARDFRKRVAELLKSLRQKQLAEFKAKIRIEERDYHLRLIERAKMESFDKGKKTGFRQGSWQSMEKAVKLFNKGLPLTDIAKIIGCQPRTIRERLQRLGVWEKIKHDMQFSKNSPDNQPVQGSLI